MKTSASKSPATTFNVQALLELCRDIELLGYALYTLFAETYVENEDAVRLWRKTACEEQNHADQFSLALRLKKDLTIQTSLDLQQAQKIKENLISTIAKVKDKPLTLQDALAFAIKLENYLADYHISCMANFHDISFINLFNAMMTSDQDHVHSIQLFYNSLLVKNNN